MLPSTSGISHQPFTLESPVRIRLGVPYGPGGSQQSRQPVTLEIAGSAPVGVAIRWHHSYVYVSAQAVAQKPLQKLAI